MAKLKEIFEEYNNDFRGLPKEEQKAVYKRCLMYSEFYWLRNKLRFTLDKEDYLELFKDDLLRIKNSYSYKQLIYYSPLLLEVVLENPDIFKEDKYFIKRGLQMVGFKESFLPYYEKHKLISSEKEYHELDAKNKVIFRLLYESQFAKSVIYGTRNAFWKNLVNVVNIYGVKGNEPAFRLALKSINYNTLVCKFSYMFIFPIAILDEERANQFMDLYVKNLSTIKHTKNAVRFFYEYYSKNSMYLVYKNDIMDLIEKEAETDKKLKKILTTIKEMK